MTLPIVTVEGRVVADPELRFAPSGVAVCKLRIVASSRRKNDQTGEWEDDKTLWLNVSCFKQLAEHVAESVAKSDIIIATGTLSTHEWEHEGQKRSQIEMAANAVAASLQFRTIPHGAGTASRSGSSGSPSSNDPWAAPPVSESGGEPPF